jgi:beta-aspartyl-peptidase (threonine type)
MNKIALAIHGGAGTILKSEITEEVENEYRQGLKKSIEAGLEILQNGGSSLDAVEASVVVLENIPLFNAGKGAVFTHDEKNEMDAAIMDGKTLDAGAIAFVKNVKNPIKLARLVMEKTEHHLLAGVGANEFAKQMNVEFAEDEYFFTDFRYQQLLQARERGLIQLDHASSEVQSPKSKVQSPNKETNRKSQIANRKSKMGTVGAVACDIDGNLAAATSTGGMTNKKFGRIGDTPIIGAGTYADNKTCAVSCTGHGEYFMKAVTAYDVAARMKYKNLSLENAAKEAVEYLTQIDGEGGLIAVDRFGNFALPFNSDGMYRGWIDENGEIFVEIYK